MELFKRFKNLKLIINCKDEEEMIHVYENIEEQLKDNPDYQYNTITLYTSSDYKNTENPYFKMLAEGYRVYLWCKGDNKEEISLNLHLK